METKIMIEIPKGFFEDKNYVTPRELLEMTIDLVTKVEKLEEDYNYELETDFSFQKENQRLKARVAELEAEFKRLGLDGAL